MGQRYASLQGSRMESQRQVAVRKQKLFAILLQGAGESGKSTVLKQLRLSYGDGFDERFRMLQAQLILKTVIRETIHVIRNIEEPEDELTALADKLGVLLEKTHLVFSEDLALTLATLQEKSEQFAESLEIVRSDLSFTYFENLKLLKTFPEWGSPQWRPSDEEILKNRTRTIGIDTNTFKDNQRYFEVYDVGGQLSERTKYLNLFSDVNQVLYVASLSAYNLQMWEDPSRHRLLDSLELFRKVSHKPQWKHVSLVLFLNKFDLFQDKYLQQNIEMPSFEGYPIPPKASEEEDEDCNLALDWFKRVFEMQLPETKSVDENFIHVTVAIQSEMMQTIITVLIKDITTKILQDFFPQI